MEPTPPHQDDDDGARHQNDVPSSSQMHSEYAHSTAARLIDVIHTATDVVGGHCYVERWMEKTPPGLDPDTMCGEFLSKERTVILSPAVIRALDLVNRLAELPASELQRMHLEPYVADALVEALCVTTHEYLHAKHLQDIGIATADWAHFAELRSRGISALGEGSVQLAAELLMPDLFATIFADGCPPQLQKAISADRHGYLAQTTAAMELFRILGGMSNCPPERLLALFISNGSGPRAIEQLALLIAPCITLSPETFQDFIIQTFDRIAVLEDTAHSDNIARAISQSIMKGFSQVLTSFSRSLLEQTPTLPPSTHDGGLA